MQCKCLLDHIRLLRRKQYLFFYSKRVIFSIHEIRSPTLNRKNYGYSLRAGNIILVASYVDPVNTP